MNARFSLEKLGAPSSTEFAQSLGKLVWLLSMSEEHTSKPIETIMPAYMAPLILNQVRLIPPSNRPLGAITWAYASHEVRQKIEAGHILELQDWRSGKDLVVVDCISPFIPREEIEQQFLTEINALTAARSEPQFEFIQ